MAYSKQAWSDGPTGGTPLSSARLAHMEDGIANAGGYVISVKEYGAKVDGTTDDTAAWQAAMAAAASISVGTRVAHDNSGTIQMRPAVACPDGTSIVTATIDIPANVNVQLSGRTTVKAGATIAGPIFRTPLSPISQDCEFTGGAIDCASLAETGLAFRYFAGLRVANTTVIDATSHSVIFGDTAASNSSFGVRSINLQVRRSRGVAVPAGSYGYWTQNCGDSDFFDAEIIGADVGVRNDGYNRFHAIHPWGYGGALPTVGFDDNGGGLYFACDADSPTVAGWHLRVANAFLSGCRIFANTSIADNTLTGVLCDTGSWVALATRFIGASATHRLATAFSGTGAFQGLHIGDVQVNVVSNAITNFGGSYTLGGGTFKMANGSAALFNISDASGVQLFNFNTSSKFLELPNAAQIRGYKDNYVTQTVRLDPSVGSVNPGTTAGLGGPLYSGSGAPTIAGTVGAYYFRTDTPGTAGQRIYVCTVAGAAGSATWVATAA